MDYNNSADGSAASSSHSDDVKSAAARPAEASVPDMRDDLSVEQLLKLLEKKADPAQGRPLVIFVPDDNSQGHNEAADNTVRETLESVAVSLIKGDLTPADITQALGNKATHKSERPFLLAPNTKLPCTPNDAYDSKNGVAASVYLKRYKLWIDSGLMYQKDIRRIEPKLMTALDNEFRGRRSDLRAILPNKQDEVNKRLVAEIGTPVRPEDRQREADRVRSAMRRRQTKTQTFVFL